jgi:hypothetical protein
MTAPHITAHALAACLLLTGAACSRPEPPPTDQPPEPQAQVGSQAETHTELRDAIQHPIDKAKAVEDTVLDAAQRRQAGIDAQAGR